MAEEIHIASPAPRIFLPSYLLPGGKHPFVVTYVTYTEVTGQEAEIADLNRRLSTLSFPQTLRSLAYLNNATLRATHRDEELQKRLVIEAMRPELAHRTIRACAQSADTSRFVFHRQQLLFVLRQALQTCPQEEGEPWINEQTWTFAETCLMANDVIGPRSNGEKIIQVTNRNEFEIMSMLLPSGELPEVGNVLHQVPRGRMLWFDIPDALPKKKGTTLIDYRLRFREKYRVDLETFYRIICLLSAWPTLFDCAREETRGHLFVRPKQIARETRIPEADLQAALKVLAITPRELGRMLANQPCQSPTTDFTLLRRYPLITISEDELVAFDPLMLTNFCTEGIYYLVLDSLGDSERDEFENYFGRVFEEYVARIFFRVYGQPRKGFATRFAASVGFTGNGGECCDALVDEGRVVVIGEVKSSRLSPHAKYSGDPKALERDIDAKFVGKDESGKRKAALQLAHSSSKLLAGVKTIIASLHNIPIDRIAPVLIVHDGALSAPLIQTYLGRRLVESLSLPEDRDVQVERLAILTSRDIEALEALSRKHPVGTILIEYARNAPGAMTFWNYVALNYSNALREDDTQVAATFGGIFEQIMDLWVRPKTEE